MRGQTTECSSFSHLCVAFTTSLGVACRCSYSSVTARKLLLSSIASSKRAVAWRPSKPSARQRHSNSNPMEGQSTEEPRVVLLGRTSFIATPPCPSNAWPHRVIIMLVSGPHAWRIWLFLLTFPTICLVCLNVVTSPSVFPSSSRSTSLFLLVLFLSVLQSCSVDFICSCFHVVSCSVGVVVRGFPPLCRSSRQRDP